MIEDYLAILLLKKSMLIAWYFSEVASAKKRDT